MIDDDDDDDHFEDDVLEDAGIGDECPDLASTGGDDIDADERAEKRRAFGVQCRRMRDLLAVHHLPSDWENTKRWVRTFEDWPDATVEAAKWIDAGWTNPDEVDDATLVVATPECAMALLKKLGYTGPADPRIDGLLDTLERALATPATAAGLISDVHRWKDVGE